MPTLPKPGDAFFTTIAGSPMKLRISVTHPTQRVDNAAFDFAQWNVKYIKAGQSVYTQGPMQVPGNHQFDIPGVNVGETWTAFVQWYDFDGQMSTKMLLADPVTAPAPP